MGGWTFEIEKRRVKRWTGRTSAFSVDEAIENAKRRDKDTWGDSETVTEYEAREVFTDDDPYY